MPFRSRAQQKLLFAKHPEVAKEFAEHTSKEEYDNLPEHVSKDKNRLKSYNQKHRRNKHA